MMRMVVAGAMVLAVAGTARAQRVSTVTGSQLMSICSAHDVRECDSYLAGVADAIAVSGGPLGKGAKLLACIAPPVRTPQLREVVIKYLRNNPQSREERGADLTVTAFSAAFPCHN